MRLALLHRRLATGMALAALVAFAAGAGFGSPYVLIATVLLGVALVWRPAPEIGRRVETASQVLVWLLFAWTAFGAFTGADALERALVLLLFLLVSESLRPLDARNDMRLYGLSFAMLIASTAYHPGFVFGIGFIGYVVLATLALMVGHLRRQAETFHIADVPIGRPFFTATAALSGVTVLMSAVVFVAFPRLPRNWSGPRLQPSGAVMAGFGDEVALSEFGTRIGANPQVVLRIEFPDGRPTNVEALHWRGRSYDHFDGVRWSRTRGIVSAVPRVIYDERWGPGAARQQIFGGAPGANVLFGLHPILDVRPRSAIRAFMDPTGDIRYFGPDEPVYTMRSGAALPPAAALRAAPEGPVPGGGAYLQLPRLDPRVARLADSLTQGISNRYDRARAIEAYFKREFRYTLDLPATRDQTSLEYFLFTRQAGHCEYFSSAMAVLLRSLGMPARNVNGFLGGTWSTGGRYLAVTQNEAHSWVEVWFPEFGWVPFDPTPAGSREASIASEGGGGLGFWPGRFFFDGLQHRWNKWIVDYNLEKQLGVLQQVGDLFQRSQPTRRLGGLGALRGILPWAVLVAALLVILRLRPRRTRRTLSPEARVYLALRRAYTRAGYRDDNATPLAWLDHLRQTRAPGAAAAERVVRSYLRARFAGEEIDESGREQMKRDLGEARHALQAKRKAA